MSYNDLLKGRFSEANRIYFVTTVTHQRLKLFNDFYVARSVINIMKHLDRDSHVTSLSWVLMPDHVHCLMQLKGDSSLPVVIKRFKAVSARSINQHLNKQGQVWQRSYYDHCLRKEEDLRHISRYIVANPLRAGLVDDIRDYPHWDAIWL